MPEKVAHINLALTIHTDTCRLAHAARRTDRTNDKSKDTFWGERVHQATCIVTDKQVLKTVRRQTIDSLKRKCIGWLGKCKHSTFTDSVSSIRLEQKDHKARKPSKWNWVLSAKWKAPNLDANVKQAIRTDLQQAIHTYIHTYGRTTRHTYIGTYNQAYIIGRTTRHTYIGTHNSHTYRCTTSYPYRRTTSHTYRCTTSQHTDVHQDIHNQKGQKSFAYIDGAIASIKRNKFIRLRHSNIRNGIREKMFP